MQSRRRGQFKAVGCRADSKVAVPPVGIPYSTTASLPLLFAGGPLLRADKGDKRQGRMAARGGTV